MHTYKVLRLAPITRPSLDLLLRIDLGLVRRRHRNHLRHRDHLPLPQLILDQLGARDHEQSLPDPEAHPRRDAAEQTADAVHAHDVLHHRHHGPHGLAHVTERLRLDARNLERVVPARQGSSDDAGADFLSLCQFGADVAVERELHPGADELGEALSRGPVGGLAERDGGASWVERRDASPRVRLLHGFQHADAGVVDGAGDEVGARAHDGDLRDASAGAGEDAREGRRHAGAAEVVVDALLGVHQDHSLSVRWRGGWVAGMVSQIATFCHGG